MSLGEIADQKLAVMMNTEGYSPSLDLDLDPWRCVDVRLLTFVDVRCCSLLCVKEDKCRRVHYSYCHVYNSYCHVYNLLSNVLLESLHFSPLALIESRA